MKYCNQCGSSNLRYIVPEGDNYQRFVCENCGEIHYINPKMIVGCMVVKDAKVLLCRRNIEPQLGKWNLPCGFLEMDEDLKTGAARETMEESLVEATNLSLFSVYSIPVFGQVFFHFMANMANDTYGITPESSEVAFFGKDDLPWDDLAFSSTRFCLERFFENPDLVPNQPYFGIHDKSKPGF